MKTEILKTLRIGLITLLFATLSITAFADSPPPPPGDPSQGGGNGPVGGGAPVGSGMLLLVALGSAYGGKKIYDARKKLIH
jgi:hypothetical protein